VPFYKGLCVKDVLKQYEDDHTCFEYLPEFPDIFNANREYIFCVSTPHMTVLQILYTNDPPKLRKYVDLVLAERKKAIFSNEANLIDICPDLKKAIMSSNQISSKPPCSFNASLQ